MPSEIPIDVEAFAGPTERILAAARDCFERRGFQKTRIEHIAVAARMARQSVYNHFSSKQQIIDSLSYQEMMKVQDEIRRRSRACRTVREKMTEALFVSAEVASGNLYINRVSLDPETSPLNYTSGTFADWRRERWRSTLELGRATGELRSDLSDDEIVGWLSFCQWSLVLRLSHAPLSEDELRALIAGFIVEPLIATRDATTDVLARELAATKAKLAELREAFVDQTLELEAFRRASGQTRDAVSSAPEPSTHERLSDSGA